MRSFIPLMLLASYAHALFFYIDNDSPKCFFEDLPKDTLVGGHYAAAEWDERSQQWQQHEGLNILITVEEVFDSDHRVVNQRGASSGKFTFSAAQAGDHRICFSPQSSSGRTGWLSTSHVSGGIRLNLDLVIGETNEIHSDDKDKLQSITSRVKDLNARLTDIKREQVFQREREAEFRDQSEHTNSRVIRWIIIQLLVIGATCAWQLSHLRSFFIKQKLT